MHFTQSTLGALAWASSAYAASHIVEVALDSKGQPALAFNPPVTTAAVGDSVVFQFYPEEHSVVQGMSSKPCEPLEGGFYSTFFSTTGKVNKKEFVVAINDTKPIWFYCSYEDHCNEGMVGVINAPMSDYTDYMKAAFKATNNVTPMPSNVPIGGVIQDFGAAVASASSSSVPTSSSVAPVKTTTMAVSTSTSVAPVKSSSMSVASSSAKTPAASTAAASTTPTPFPGSAASVSVAGGAVALAAVGLGFIAL